MKINHQSYVETEYDKIKNTLQSLSTPIKTLKPGNASSSHYETSPSEFSVTNAN